MLPFTYVPFGGALQWPAECEWQAAESQTRCCEYCVKGQTHDDKSVCNGWASLLKVGPSLPSSTTTALCQPCAMQTPVWTSFNSNPVTEAEERRKSGYLWKKKQKIGFVPKNRNWEVKFNFLTNKPIFKKNNKYIYIFFNSKRTQYPFSWLSTTNLPVLMGF